MDVPTIEAPKPRLGGVLWDLIESAANCGVRVMILLLFLSIVSYGIFSASSQSQSSSYKKELKVEITPPSEDEEVHESSCACLDTKSGRKRTKGTKAGQQVVERGLDVKDTCSVQ